MATASHEMARDRSARESGSPAHRPFTVRRAPLLVGAGTLVVALLWMLGPPTGHDLAAQTARTDFVRDYGFTPIDLRWFSGTNSLGYSLWTTWVMAELGVRLAGVLAAAFSAALVTVLFVKHGARRPLIGGITAGACQLINLVEGRVTFALGCVIGLATLLVIAGRRTSGRLWLAAAGSAVATTGSPVVGLYLLVAAGALILTRQVWAGTALGAGVGSALVLTSFVFGDGGWEPFTYRDARDALLATLVATVVLPRRLRVVRIAGLIAAAMVITAFVLHTPVGNNATRLSCVFAVPTVAAFIEARFYLVALAVIATAWPQQLTARRVFVSGPSSHAAYYQPLERAIARRGALVGRLEVPETMAHWDTTYLARHVLLARGWLRQTDVKLNYDTFFKKPPSAARYSAWLDHNAVQYVAVPDATLSGAGRHEVASIKGSPRLRAVWRNEHWTLYEVLRGAPIAASPAQLVDATPARLTLSAPANSRVTIHLRWWRWYQVITDDAGACISPSSAGLVELTTAHGGRYTITSSLVGSSGHCS